MAENVGLRWKSLKKGACLFVGLFLVLERIL